MDNTDYAWVAGFIDGEGNIGKTYTKYRGGKKYYRIQLSISQIDRRVLDKVQSILGGKVYGPYNPKTEKSKPYFSYVLYGEEAVCDCIRKTQPYLSSAKMDQFINAYNDYLDHCRREK